MTLAATRNRMQHSSFGRLLLVGVMLVAFAVQGFVAQTHIHFQADSGVVLKIDAGAPGHKNVPANDDPANCPLCKEILHSGQFVAPLWLAFFLPALAVAGIETTTHIPTRLSASSFCWCSRAPPRH